LPISYIIPFAGNEKAAELETSNENLSRFNEVARSRELRMVQLKKEVNRLWVDQGKLPLYKIKQSEGL